MRKFLLAARLLTVTACTTPPQPPKTPAQALVEARAGLGSAVAAFMLNKVCATLVLASAMSRSRSSRQVLRSVLGSTPMIRAICSCGMPMTEEVIKLARQYGRYGYRLVTALLRPAGWWVNHVA